MKKLFVTITLLAALVGSAFAENFIKYASYEIDKGKTIYTYVDIDAREPYDPEEESIDYLIFLQSEYDDVEFDLLVTPENIPGICMEMSNKHRIYHTLQVMENCEFEYLVCYDGTVMRYMYTRRDE